MNKIKLSSYLLLLLLIAAFLSGCTGTETTENNYNYKYDSIKIGSILPLTGEFSSPGSYLQRGIDIAAGELNEKGGIDGKKVEIVYKDSRGDPQVSAEMINGLAEEGITTVIGGLTSETTLSMADVAEKKGIVLISPTATSGKLSDYPSFYRTTGSNYATGTAMALFLNGLVQDPQNAALIYLNDSYGADLRDATLETLNNLGIYVIYSAGFKEGFGNNSVAYDEILMKNPDAVVLIAHVSDASDIVNQIRASGMDMPIICSETVQLDEMIEKTAGSYKGLYSVAPFWKPEGEEFHRRYQENYPGEEPNYLAAYAYDSLMVAADAMRRQGTTSDSVLKGLNSSRYFDVSGLKIFTDSGDLQLPLFSVWEIRDNSWTRLKQLYYVHEKSGKSGIILSDDPDEGIEDLKDPYLIGVALPLSGDLSEYGLSTKEGIDMAVKEINSGSFIAGISVEAVYRDNAGSPEKTEEIADEFIKSGIPVVIGPSASNAAIALAEIAGGNKFVMVSPSASTPILSEYKDYVFRTIGSDSAHATTLSAIISHKTGVNSPAVLYIDNTYGNGFKNVFITDYEKSGGEVLMAEKIAPGQTDFSVLSDKVQSSGADALVLISFASEGLDFLDTFTKTEADIPVYVTEGMNVNDFFIRTENYAGEIYMTIPDMDTPTKFTDAFINQYKLDYNKREPNYYVQSGYDTMMVVADSINRGGYSIDGIRNGLDDCRLYGLTGEKEFDDSGDVVPVYILMKAGNGRWERKEKYELDNLVISYA
ncbi:ABC transporter substrate-binding protein [Methanoplanus endosymbiosus]|uniref:ABC transporter substrate-binding protein n=1 Tax=Methanoplanus endosymbiosus TaxID=33865 RepID=A0A9E7PNM0_9EURY|nr:ABC transporter substrate-binding protein [Methanoplanus endosymbiosus]UUX92642.1 ABC transporter substrate-binding protein [Methanoplanus endosymbiosus]